MKRATSLYIDLIRFIAALTVWFYHVSLARFTDGLLWQAHLYGETAVVVFFILSGFVIAHVLASREKTAVQYAANRFARLYSVIIPALLLTAICNAIGSLKSPELYSAGYSYLNGDPLIRYPATFMLVNRWWLGSLEPNANQPFWSLSFEAAYYVAIGLMAFSRGALRTIAVATWAMLVGPTIVIMAPLWFFGFGAYHLSLHHRLRAGLAFPLWLMTGFLLLICWRLEPSGFSIIIPYVQRDTLLSDYAAAICFALNLIAFNGLGQTAEKMFAQLGPLLRWLGSLTFVLYLCHFPLLQFFTAFAVGAPSSWTQRVWVVGATGLIIIVLTPLCDYTKGTYKRLFLRAISAAQVLRALRVAETG